MLFHKSIVRCLGYFQVRSRCRSLARRLVLRLRSSSKICMLVRRWQCLHLWRETKTPFDHVKLDIRNGQGTSFDIKECPSSLNFLRFYENTYCLADGKEYSVGGVMRGDGGFALDTRTFFWYDMTKEVAEYVEGPSLINKRSKCGVGSFDRCLTFNLF